MVDQKTAKKYRASSNKREEWEKDVRSSDGDSFNNGANQLKKQDDGINTAKYSNVAILHSLYQALSVEALKNERNSAEVKVFNIYVEGAGTDAIYDGGIISKVYNWRGSVSGKGHSGVSQLVCKAVAMVKTRLGCYKGEESNTELHFDVFGFSRGATCARLFSYLAVRGKNEILPCEEEFKDSMASDSFKSGALQFLDKSLYKSVTVDFLGLFDTVSSIGAISEKTYKNNVTDYGLFSPTLDGVKSTFQLCAMDEFRSHFALTDIGKVIKGQNAEVFIPGCHSDVGGGYVDNDDCSFRIEIGKQVGIHYYGKPDYERYSYPIDTINSEDGKTMKMGLDCFMKLGWIQDKSQYGEQFGVDSTSLEASIKRTVKCGYSNIPLTMMKKRTVLKTSRDAFREIPQDYSINELFSEWRDELLGYVSKSGRDWYYPGGSFSSDSYCRLRNYLHFSSKNSIGFTPSYKNGSICRYLYHGDENDSDQNYTVNAY